MIELFNPFGKRFENTRASSIIAGAGGGGDGVTAARDEHRVDEPDASGVDARECGSNGRIAPKPLCGVERTNLLAGRDRGE
jgi:hypothetical protein